MLRPREWVIGITLGSFLFCSLALLLICSAHNSRTRSRTNGAQVAHKSRTSRAQSRTQVAHKSRTKLTKSRTNTKSSKMLPSPTFTAFTTLEPHLATTSAREWMLSSNSNTVLWTAASSSNTMVWKLLLEHSAVEIQVRQAPGHNMSHLFQSFVCRFVTILLMRQSTHTHPTANQSVTALNAKTIVDNT